MDLWREFKVENWSLDMYFEMYDRTFGLCNERRMEYLGVLFADVDSPNNIYFSRSLVINEETKWPSSRL